MTHLRSRFITTFEVPSRHLRSHLVTIFEVSCLVSSSFLRPHLIIFGGLVSHFIKKTRFVDFQKKGPKSALLKISWKIPVIFAIPATAIQFLSFSVSLFDQSILRSRDSTRGLMSSSQAASTSHVPPAVEISHTQQS